MHICPDMNLSYLAEEMGSTANAKDAEKFRDFLIAYGYKNTCDISEKNWLALLNEALHDSNA